MPRFLIEREVPGAEKLTRDELRTISQKSCGILEELGPRIQWIESYVTNGKIYCIYLAPSDQLIRRHAEEGGFPANRIAEIKEVFGPATAEGPR